MSFVASCHHRVVQCFRMHGNAKHGLDHKVSLSEFQAAFRARHGAAGKGNPTVRSSNVKSPLRSNVETGREARGTVVERKRETKCPPAGRDAKRSRNLAKCACVWRGSVATRLCTLRDCRPDSATGESDRRSGRLGRGPGCGSAELVVTRVTGTGTGGTGSVRFRLVKRTYVVWAPPSARP